MESLFILEEKLILEILRLCRRKMAWAMLGENVSDGVLC